jgi:tripartite-type tricarboxylate transporter receptor subunit TctC
MMMSYTVSQLVDLFQTTTNLHKHNSKGKTKALASQTKTRLPGQQAHQIKTAAEALSRSVARE